jgi:hypothetical protein
VDGDGDLDAFVANNDAANKVWLNDGSGIFTDSGQNLGSSESYGYDVMLGDVDGDGDLDAFVANATEGFVPNVVWLNNGSGVFSDSGQSLGNSASTSVSLGDVDGDGDLDAFVANFWDSNKVWLNNGSGTFTDSGQNQGESNSRKVSLGDLDGDGDLDAFVANDDTNRVWLNIPLEIAITDTTDAEDSGSISFIVSISSTYSLPVTVGFETIDSTAVAGTDYTALSGDLTIPAGSTADTIVVSIINDSLVENDETFIIVLSDAVNATIVDSIGVGTITDDDEIIQEKITITSPNGGEWFSPGTEQEITWTCSYGGNLIIEYSFDDGENWLVEKSQVYSLLYSYQWVVPEVYSSNCKIRITSLSFPNTVDQSDSSFTIFPTTIQPPSDIQIVADVNDLEKLNISWTPSPDETIITGYRIYRSLNPDLTEPIPVESFSSEDDLNEAEKTKTIFLSTVLKTETSYGDLYKHTDGVTYYYWVEAFADNISSVKASSTIDIEAGIKITLLEFNVDLPYPNPFNPTVTIQYQVPVDCYVELVIYDITGKSIAVLRDGLETIGYHQAIWNGIDDNGNTVSSGVYLYRFSAGTYTAQGKIMFLK